MKVELRKFKAFEKMSRGTCCYHAELWVDGKKAGEVSNDGGGGSERLIVPGDIRARICSAQQKLPLVTPEWGGTPYQRHFEDLCQELAFRRLEIKGLKSDLRRYAKKLMVRIANRAYGDDSWTVVVCEDWKMKLAALRSGGVVVERCWNEETEARLAGLSAEPDFILLQE
jgi:hypothetical protein